jgi:UDP-2,3-diacylglucosamine hydrolase
MHLTEAASPTFLAFERLLTRAEADEVYLLGDLCEVWVGDDDDAPLARRFVDLLAAVARRARVFVMRGNRDFLFGSRFEADSGVTLIPDPWALDGNVLLAHGDAFCVDDAAYQQARRLLRSADWQRDVLAKPLAERRAMAEAMREQSRRSNANKAENIMDVSADEVERVMRENERRVLIHGHTHRPGVHRESWGLRYVLGAWEHCGWALVQQDHAFELQCLPLRA